jgi:dienelactone hydrolase
MNPPEVDGRFHLTDEPFDYEIKTLPHGSEKYTLSEVTFASPVTTPHEANNVVHCEYYQPRGGAGRRPAVIVLHILGGDFVLSRLFAHSLNEAGVSALFLKMPYYGPRRVEGVSRRMISEDPHETVAGMTQAVLDIRRATAWLASRDEVDPDQIGIFGISLGGITAALAAETEPQIKNVCLVLAGGDFPRLAAESAEFAKYRERFKASGRDGAEFNRVVAEVDPLRFADQLKNRPMLMLNARSDEVVPRACTDALWEKAGRPEIVWYNGGHYTAMKSLPLAMLKVNRFFASDGQQPGGVETD